MNPRHLPRLATLACALALGLGSVTALAGPDAALYGPKAPKGSTFVRAYNAGTSTLDVSVGNTDLNDIAPQAASDFSFMPAGSYRAQVGSTSLPLKLEPEHYYTLVNLPGQAPRLVEEAPFGSKQKALLRVQNLSDRTLSLKTADGKTPVVEAVAPNSHGERQINPVKVALALFDGERKVSDLKPVSLARGEVTSLFVTGRATTLAPVWVTPPAPAD